MTITAYAPTDVGSVSVGDGCGASHTVIEGVKGGHGIECPICGPRLLSIPSLGWAGSPHGVKLTVDETAALEDAKATGLTAQSLAAKAIGEKIASLVMADQMGAQAKPAAPAEVAPADVMTALGKLPPEELAVLLRAAGLVPEDASEDVPVDKPVASSTRTRRTSK